MMFSIIIPTFKNYDYLKFTIESIYENSTYKHQLIVHINGKDFSTKKYLEDHKIQYTQTDENVGLCKGVNLASKLSLTNYIVYAHDDMYFLPNWDDVMYTEIKNINHNFFYLSATQIGPIEYNNTIPNHIFFDCGSNIETFEKKKLLDNFNKLKFFDLQGSHWAPHVIHRDLWEKIGGFSEEFDPGFGSDPDLNMKLWKENVRIFKGLSKSRVYHFGSLTTRKNNLIIKNNANKTFLMKWKISINFFVTHYLKRGSTYNGPLGNFELKFSNILEFVRCKIKYLYLFIRFYYD